MLQLLAALLCNVLSMSTEDTGTQMMRGNVLGPKSTAVLIVVVFASTLSFFFLVGRYTTLYSQQTEGVVGGCARRSVGCCCLRNDVTNLVVRRQRRRSSIVVPAAATSASASTATSTATSPETSQAVLYASYKMQNHMRFAVQQRLKQRLAERAAGKVTEEDGGGNNATSSIPHMSALARVKSVRTRTVESIQRNHTASRTMAVRAIQRKQTARRQSVQARVAARNKAKRSNALQKCKIFSDLEAASIATIIDKMEYEAVTAGTPIVTQGDVANTFYLIMSGTCDVVINDKVVASLKELQVFGESALSQDALRVATVVATVDVQVLRLSKQKLDALLRSGTLTSDCVRKIQKVAKEREVENRLKDGGGGSVAQQEQQEINKVKALLIQVLKSKKTLHAFMKKADKQGTGYIPKKHVRKLLQSVETKLKVTATIDFEIVWMSMLSMTMTKNKMMIKNIVLEEWLFGTPTTKEASII